MLATGAWPLRGIWQTLLRHSFPTCLQDLPHIPVDVAEVCALRCFKPPIHQPTLAASYLTTLPVASRAMEGVAVKPKGRRRTKKADAAAAAAAGAGAAVARPAATDATVEGTELTEPEEAVQPRPSLSQRVVKSLKQLSQLGVTSKSEVGTRWD